MDATKSGNRKMSLFKNEFRKYEVSFDYCYVGTGDQITPSTCIGLAPVSSEAIIADFHGTIAAIYYNPMNRSLLITAVSS